jgi:hypothetical protein
MSFIDEAAREINVKVVWYSASPSTAAALVRYVGERTRPDLKRMQVLDGGGSSVTHLQFVPAGLGTIRGFATRFHLYAVESAAGSIEGDEARLLLFRGADACVFVGGPDQAHALARVDAIFAAQGYSNVPIVYAVERAGGVDAVTRGRGLGFPDGDSFEIDPQSGVGVFDALKAIARKVLLALAGREGASRPTPAPGTRPTAITQGALRAAPTLEETQQGLDAWQRAYHAKAIWVLGLEHTRLTPTDVPEGYPAHTIHVIRPAASDGFALMSNGFSRDATERV